MIVGEADVVIESLDLDGTLVIDTTQCPGACVIVRDLVIVNRGWELTPLQPVEMLSLPEVLRIRGYKLVKHGAEMIMPHSSCVASTVQFFQILLSTLTLPSVLVWPSSIFIARSRFLYANSNCIIYICLHVQPHSGLPSSFSTVNLSANCNSFSFANMVSHPRTALSLFLFSFLFLNMVFVHSSVFLIAIA